jgi:homoserine kinase
VTLKRRRLVRVPASSANLGPGFDVLAAALSLQLEVEVQESGSFAVHTELDVPRDKSNLVVRGFERLHPADAFEFTISSEIPLSGGLGSSAAAVVAGLLAADHLFELDADVLGLAGELEGHPDNVAAALEGGFVICEGARAHRFEEAGAQSFEEPGAQSFEEAGALRFEGSRAHRFEPPMGLEAVLVVPHDPVETAAARAALPESVPLADAVFNVSHAATLILGLAHGDFDLIAAGLQDRLHQPYRAHLYPRSAELLERAPSLGALGATISGAGPAVLVWCRYEQTGAVVAALEREVAGWAKVIRAPFESHGADVRGM